MCSAIYDGKHRCSYNNATANIIMHHFYNSPKAFSRQYYTTCT